MTTLTTGTDDVIGARTARRDALAERVTTGLLASMELLAVHLGVELGLYASLATDGPATPPELARRAAVHPRYAREWLEQQAAAGMLDVIGPAPDDRADARRYALPAGHAEALLDPDSPAAVGALPQGLVAIAGVVEPLLAAYRSGNGVRFGDYGTGIRHGIGGMNRPMFTNDLASWLLAAGVGDHLATREHPHVLDVGCGTGWSTVALARALPTAQIVGIDLDQASVEDAARNVVAAGVADRVRVELADAAALESEDRYDLVCLFEALHDMGDPVGALRSIRAVLADGASLVLADERVGDTFTAPADFNDRLMYAFSVVHCLPATMAEDPVVATGTAIRKSTVERYGTDAGFASVTELPVENPFWRLYHFLP